MIAQIDNRRAKAIANRDAWNAHFPPGTFVRVWQSLPAGTWIVAPTMSVAFLHGPGVAVHVVNVCAPVFLSNLEPITPAALALLTHDPAIEVGNAELAAAALDQRRFDVRASRAFSQLPVGDRS